MHENIYYWYWDTYLFGTFFGMVNPVLQIMNLELENCNEKNLSYNITPNSYMLSGTICPGKKMDPRGLH